MKLGIMQPYLFPYLGYFQLIHAVDKFVVYNDVNYIKQGWINRNRILNQKEALMFTVPLKNAGSFSKINEVEINDQLYKGWKDKFLRTLELNYKKAPYFPEIAALIEKVLSTGYKLIAELAVSSLLAVCDYLELQRDFISTSTIYQNQNLSGTARVIDICKQENVSHYINPMGGKVLYDKKEFKDQGLELSFIQPTLAEYRQFREGFVPWLSIIDVLMFNSAGETRLLLEKYQLI